MSKVVEFLLAFIGIGLLFLGVIFLIAGSIENIEIGAVMIIIAIVMFIFIYLMERIRASKPTLVSQTFNVKMEGSGKFDDKQLKCKSCGSPITEKDLKIVQGGIMTTCPYCGTVSALEEEPKW